MRVATPNAIVVRPAARRDLDALVAIERASFSDPWTMESFSSALTLDRMRVLVAEESSGFDGGAAPALLGYVLALLIGVEAEIADLAVAPAARRRGIGRLLLERMVGELDARGVHTVFLEVRESNDAARALYASQEFVTVGRRPGYYRHPTEDALLLRRAIAPG